MTREQFIEKIAPFARDLAKEYNILPSLIMGVACHESDFGESGLAEKGNNLFGIKGEYKGDSVTMRTFEYENGQRIDIDAKFRKYPSYLESMRDFCDLLKNGVSWNHTIYHSVIGVTDWKEVIEKFAKTPYMTDPAYSKLLTGITSTYKLYEYNDVTGEIVETPAPTEEKAPEVAPTEPAPTEPTLEEERPTEPAPTDEQAPEPAPRKIEEKELEYPYPNMIFKLGSRGNYVKIIQKHLGCKADGIFGEITRAFTIVHQHENNLSIDGIVGIETWTSLFS